MKLSIGEKPDDNAAANRRKNIRDGHDNNSYGVIVYRCH